MELTRAITRLTTVFFCVFLSGLVFADRNYPCLDASILDFTDRGTITDTPCVLATKKVLVEGGYQYADLVGDGGRLQSVPQMEVALGLPLKTEIFALLPVYEHQTGPLVTGFTATAIGVKKEMFHGEKWVVSGQGIITPPGGSTAFGNPNTSYTINAILGYTISSQFSLTSMLGRSSISSASAAGGGRYNSFNPSIALLYSPTEKLNFFGEIYSQTQTYVDEGAGYDVDGGIIYILSKSTALDIEIGQRIHGNIGEIEKYVGAGLTFLMN